MTYAGDKQIINAKRGEGLRQLQLYHKLIAEE